MRRYASVGNQNAATDNTILALNSISTVKPHIYEVIFGSAAAPADQAFNIQCQRFATTAGTAVTAVTPQPLDPGDPASLVTAGSNYSAEPGYTAGAVLLSVSLNQQATFRWVSPPDEGMILSTTATTGIGLVFKLVSGGTALCEATFHHAE